MEARPFLGWLDHDPSERERSQRILALFHEKESRDELGLGSVRDAIADLLFPGTSTIHTRVRYFLFIPWIYRQLEADGVRAAELPRKLRQAETVLVEHLLAQGEKEGVFGRMARGSLKRLPSSIYWSGLESWGIRRGFESQDELVRTFDQLHRAAQRHHGRRADEGGLDDAPVAVWDPELPATPEGFPETAQFALTHEEADYLRHRIVHSNPASLLAWLVADEAADAVDAPWMHPRFASFKAEHRELLDHARLFAEVMQGAALHYNVLLAELKGATELEKQHRTEYEAWTERVQHIGVAEWSLLRFFALVTSGGRPVPSRTRDFVEAWVGLVVGGPDALKSSAAATLVRRRETALKGTRSRFVNATALSQWSGSSGLGLMTFRWSTAQRFVAEIHEGRTQKRGS
jgi:hypothetical protein